MAAEEVDQWYLLHVKQGRRKPSSRIEARKKNLATKNVCGDWACHSRGSKLATVRNE